jgi:hypothetical protein
MIRRTSDDNWLTESVVKTFMNFRLIIKINIFTNTSNTVINLNIRDTEMIESIHQDIKYTMNLNDMIKFMMTIENINFEIFFRLTRIIRMIQTRLILISFLFIQKLHEIKMILTEFKNHFSIQINHQTSMNIHDSVRAWKSHDKAICRDDVDVLMIYH